MNLGVLKGIDELIYRIYKFSKYVIFSILNKDLKLKRFIKEFSYIFTHINLGEKIIPWIPIKAKLWLDKNLKHNMILYEYGSGISTLYFSSKVKEIHSIEHDKDWYEKMNEKLQKMEKQNYEYSLIEPDFQYEKDSRRTSSIYNSQLENYQYSNFKKYVKSIDKYPDKYFDLIFIDGRARIACILHSIKKIQSGGFIVLDNSDEKQYKIAHKILKKYKKLDFFGIAPSNPYLKYTKISFWKMTIWKIE
jgi:hypothetical protein